jgi:DNA (cytosine-5)-methyltransferase 1
MNKLTVIDIFCGAGGFSEGFRQQGFGIVLGIDSWDAAIKTFNHNFNLNCPVKNVLAFEKSVEEIEALPDTDLIIGSPPCVTFSSSNISGKADKTSGVTLTQVFLKIIAVKKWKQNSKLKAWFMENVPSSIKHLGSEYTFEELGLGDWAARNKIGRSKVAVRLEGNQPIINSADYGSPQSRERVISGEIIKRKKLVVPKTTHSKINIEGLNPWKTLKEIKGKLPSPSSNESLEKVTDPNYPWISISLSKLTDHFYDTGLFECEWKQSRYLKVNHPYMGKMSFPENEDKPSRTITATKIGSSRETIIYRSEFNRKGDGEFRTPTVRESACIMGFPITYQFIGSEGMKCKLIGNAVCPSVSRAFAGQVRKELELGELKDAIICHDSNLINVHNLNTYSGKEFGNPPRRNKGSRFRRHPFKAGNLTVTLSNYDIDKNEKRAGKWKTSVQYGNGEGFPTYNFHNGFYKKLEPFIIKVKCGEKFLEIIDNGFSEKIGQRSALQEMYEVQQSKDGLLEPTVLVEEVGKLIEQIVNVQEIFVQKGKIIFKNKQAVPLRQLFALYAINKISSIANNGANKGGLWNKKKG